MTVCVCVTSICRFLCRDQMWEQIYYYELRRDKAGQITGTYTKLLGAGVAQTVERLVTSWTTEGSEFDTRYGAKSSLLHVVQTCSGVQSASYPMCTGGSFPGGKAAGA
jgi:hypothetical protein